MPITAPAIRIRDLSDDVVAARAKTTRLLGRTPCDVCGNAANHFVRCDGEDVNSFRCHTDMVSLAKELHVKGFEVIVVPMTNPVQLMTDSSQAIQDVVDQLETQPFQFAVRFVQLERLVEQLNARYGSL